MSPIDERLKSLNIVLPDVMPPAVDGYVLDSGGRQRVRPLASNRSVLERHYNRDNNEFV
jgi:hypothetical protein